MREEEEGEEINGTGPLNPLVLESGEEDILEMSCISKDTIFELNEMNTLIIIFFQFFFGLYIIILIFLY